LRWATSQQQIAVAARKKGLSKLVVDGSPTLKCAALLVGEHLSGHRDVGNLDGQWRPWLTTFAPILISFWRRLVRDHGSAVFGMASVHKKLPRL
jgi:hypothetical protein